MLLPALDAGGQIFLPKAALHRCLDFSDDLLAMTARFLHLRGENPVAHRIERAEPQIFELEPYIVEAETVGNGGIDLKRLAGDAPALVQWKRGQRAHVVQAVGELHQNDPDIPGHGHEHLSEILGLGLGAAFEADLRQLADAVYEFSNFLAELLCYLRLGGVGILDDVVKNRGNNALVIQVHFRQDFSDLDWMLNVGFAGGATLSLVRLGAKLVGAINLPDLIRLEIVIGQSAEIAYQEHGRSPASGNLRNANGTTGRYLSVRAEVLPWEVRVQAVRLARFPVPRLLRSPSPAPGP